MRTAHPSPDEIIQPLKFPTRMSPHTAPDLPPPAADCASEPPGSRRIMLQGCGTPVSVTASSTSLAPARAGGCREAVSLGRRQNTTAQLPSPPERSSGAGAHPLSL